MSQQLSTQVAVVGAGPCGVTLANYLGLFGIRTLLIERSTEILDYPRAVGADDEALRSWQGVGLTQELLRDMIQNVPARYFSSTGRCFAEVAPKEQPFGWPRRNLFIQPRTEVTLRKGLERFPSVTLLQGTAVTALQQDERQVVLQATSPDGELRIEADYVIGADGGRSTVRELIGVALEGKTHTNKWLVIDVTDDTLDAPFTGIHCHPQRPSMSIHLPFGYRRLEFQLKPDESEEDVLRPEHLATLMRKHYPAGQPLPPVQRARIYLHHSRIAQRFRVGRVFLAGDAAHLQPPFFGQGMNSGLRDATNLAWKLAFVLQGKVSATILDSYETERRGHALAMVNFATWIGSFYKPSSRLTEFFRDLFFRGVQWLPSVRDHILQLKFKPMPRYTNGIVLPLAAAAGDADPVGRMFMQPTVEREGVSIKLDDAIGPAFAVIGIGHDPLQSLDDASRQFTQRLGVRTVEIQRSRSPRAARPDTSTILLDDVQGRFRDWLLRHPTWDLIVLRPDRYVAGVGHRSELNSLLSRLARVVA
jgi:3-(3-hydroxy-phenyl)propionate hydroxylase